MDSTDWLRHFEKNRLHRPEPDWARPTPFPAPAATALARSLAHFQLGESGEGRTLLAEARRTWPDDADYVAALALFVAEEQEHARLLERLVARLGGTLVAHHWSHRCFRTLRRALGVTFEIQTLVVAEIIGTAYYRLLRSTGDVVLRQVCELMLRDEGPHLRFHGERIALSQRRWSTPRAGLWTVQFRLLFAAAVAAAWVDHRPALLALGIDRRLFSAETRSEARAWLRRRAEERRGEQTENDQQQPEPARTPTGTSAAGSATTSLVTPRPAATSAPTRAETSDWRRPASRPPRTTPTAASG